MNTLLYYLLQVVMASGILYLYYHIALRNKKFHQYNRFYLLGAVIISILVPFFSIPVYFSEQETQSSIVLQTLTVISYPVTEVTAGMPATDNPGASAFSLTDILYCTYVLFVLLVFSKIVLSLLRIRRLKRNNAAEKIDTIRFINTSEPGTPFSFFRWMFWNKNIELRSEKGEQVFRHELFHIQQKHSIDLLFIELLTAVFWINPFYHLMKKELRAIHEFLADQFAATKSDKWEYAETLLMQALQTKNRLVNPFFHNQIKRRIAMITNPQKTSYRYLRKLLVLPVAVLVIVLFAFRYKSENRTTVASLKEQITIVVDAGHGGNDPGVQSPDNKFNEAQLSLQLAKKIQLLAPDYNINVVLTRKGNAFPGGATTNAESHLKRMEIAARAKPAVFISLHINSVMGKEFQKTNSGIEAYVSATRNDEEGRRIASAILQELSAIYKTATELKMRKGNSIPVLDNNTCPAVILECGFINNAADLAFITDPANQEKIARKILAGIAGYKNYSASSSLIDAPSQGPLQKAVVLTDKDTFLVEADSLIFDMRKKNADATSPLVIINGKKVSYSYLTGKEIQAEGIKVYSRNDQRAIRTYGRDAANGLIVFEGATVNEQQATDRPILDTPKRKDGVRMHHKDAGKNGLKEVIVTGHGKKNIVRSDVVTTEGKKQRADVVTVQGHGVLKPDPATNTVTIPFSTQQGGEAEIIVSDKASSAESMKVKTTLVSGPNHLKFDVSSLPKGEYTIVVKVGDAAKKPVRTYNMVKQ